MQTALFIRFLLLIDSLPFMVEDLDATSIAQSKQRTFEPSHKLIGLASFLAIQQSSCPLHACLLGSFRVTQRFHLPLLHRHLPLKHLTHVNGVPGRLVGALSGRGSERGESVADEQSLTVQECTSRGDDVRQGLDERTGRFVDQLRAVRIQYVLGDGLLFLPEMWLHFAHRNGDAVVVVVTVGHESLVLWRSFQVLVVPNPVAKTLVWLQFSLAIWNGIPIKRMRRGKTMNYDMDHTHEMM